MESKIQIIRRLMEKNIEELKPNPENLDKTTRDTMMAVDKVLLGAKNICKLDDCDVDGKVSGGILGKFFNFNKTYTNKNKSHDLLPETAKDIIENGFDVFVAVDCCSKCKELKTLIDAGIKVVVIDHHEYNDEDKAMFDGENSFIVNPNLNKPNNTSCAVVVWYFLHFSGYIESSFMNTHKNWFLEDWVGISAVADSADMSDPANLYFIRGLYEKTRDPFILTFKNYGSMKNVVTFKIIPLINAAIRNSRPYLVEQVIMPESQSLAKEMMNKLLNEKKIHDATVARLFEQTKPKIGENMVIAVVDKKDANYVGLLAGKIAGKYKKTSFVVYDDGETFRGSGRTGNHLEKTDFEEVEGVDVVGHNKAFGVCIEKKREVLEALQRLVGKPKEKKAVDTYDSDSPEIYHYILESGKINEYLSSEECIEIDLNVTYDDTFDVSQYPNTVDFVHPSKGYTLRTFNRAYGDINPGDVVRVQPIKAKGIALALIQEDY